jgi:hypothetical protein
MGCKGYKDYKKNSTHQEVSDTSIKNGALLAASFCQSCHLLPDPSILDTKTWENGVLPHMGPLLGIFEYNYVKYPNNRNDVDLPRNFYPSKPLLNDAQWQNIIDYYTALSPDSLPPQNRSDSIQKHLQLFSIETPDFKYANPTTCLIKIDTTVFPHQLWTADILKKGLYRYSKELNLLDSISTLGPIVDLSILQNNLVACDIGILNPTNGKFGRAQIIKNNPLQGIRLDSILMDKLARPVQITAGDLNNDGKTDYLVCEFGYLTGALSWLENIGNNKFKRHVLSEMPGAIKAYITDYNQDGLPDLWVLFAQAEEGIYLFTNKGNGQFDQQAILRFPPSNGSTYFELVDFNKDGFPDILYTCGDNGDFSQVLKPYHGVYIYLNDTKNRFTQTYFFPLNGCYKAMARDFDGDGDLDIATISFFANFSRQPEEGFVYLENEGQLKFKPFSSPELQVGRWFTMDTGDLDGDGKIDIVLGNCSFGPTIERSDFNWKKGPPFIVLKNRGK